jgi:alkylation response protein AidB-like acyl-CoA dehydrogenase
MDLKLSEEQLILKETVRSFILKEFPEDYISQLCLNKEYPPEFDKKIAELGLLGISFPEKYNGSNLGPIEVAIVIEELSRYSIDLGISYGLNLLGGLIILNFGTEIQKNYYLIGMIKGDLSFSIGYYEPFLFNDLSKINGYLSVNEGKLKINGNTIYSERRDPDKNFILLPLNKKGKLAFVLLPQNLLRKGEISDTLGRDLLGLVKYSIKDIDCREDQLLSKGKEMLTFMVNWMKLINFMSCIGNMGTVIDETINYAKEREQFGRPIGTFQSLQHLIVDTKLKIDASRLFGYWIAWQLEKTHNNGKDFSLLKEINMANSYITQAFVDAVNTGMQVMGGYGYMMENHMERYIRDARMTTCFVEDAFLQKMLIAEKLGLIPNESNR